MLVAAQFLCSKVRAGGEPRSRRMVGDALGISEQAAAALEFRSLRKLRSLLSQKLSATDFGDFLE